MGKGYLKIRTVSAGEAAIIGNASVEIADKHGHILYTTQTDENGNTYDIPLSAPDKSHSLNPDYTGPHFSRYDILVHADGYRPVMYKGISIFDTTTTLQTVVMDPGSEEDGIKQVNVGRHALDLPEEQGIEKQAIQSDMIPNVIISVGSRGNNVLHIQQAINRLSEVYPGRLWRIKEDGIFENGTRDAVMAFQRLFNLKEDGLVGPVTWNTLMMEIFKHHRDSNTFAQSAVAFGGDAVDNRPLTQIMKVMMANHILFSCGWY